MCLERINYRSFRVMRLANGKNMTNIPAKFYAIRHNMTRSKTFPSYFIGKTEVPHRRHSSFYNLILLDLRTPIIMIHFFSLSLCVCYKSLKNMGSDQKASGLLR